MASLCNSSLVNTQKVYAPSENGSTRSGRLRDEEKIGGAAAGSLVGGIPPGGEFHRGRVTHDDLLVGGAPRATRTNFGFGSSIKVVEPTHEELHDTGGVQRLWKDPSEFFQRTQGQPSTLLARDRQLAGFLSAQTSSTRVYENSQGYHAQGIHQPSDWSTSSGAAHTGFSKNQSEWATTNKLTEIRPTRTHNLHQADMKYRETQGSNFGTLGR